VQLPGTETMMQMMRKHRPTGRARSSTFPVVNRRFAPAPAIVSVAFFAS